jgi:hypothetical protein
LIGATSRLHSLTQHCHIAFERITSRWHAERVTFRAPIGHWLIVCRCSFRCATPTSMLIAAPTHARTTPHERKCPGHWKLAKAPPLDCYVHSSCKIHDSLFHSRSPRFLPPLPFLPLFTAALCANALVRPRIMNLLVCVCPTMASCLGNHLATLAAWRTVSTAFDKMLRDRISETLYMRHAFYKWFAETVSFLGRMGFMGFIRGPLMRLITRHIMGPIMGPIMSLRIGPQHRPHYGPIMGPMMGHMMGSSWAPLWAPLWAP